MIAGFDLMLAQLLGDPLPPLPAIPGRVHQYVDEPPTAPEDLAMLSTVEVARLTGLSRSGAALRIATAAASGDWSGLLQPSAARLQPATSAAIERNSNHLRSIKPQAAPLKTATKTAQVGAK